MELASECRSRKCPTEILPRTVPHYVHQPTTSGKYSIEEDFLLSNVSSHTCPSKMWTGTIKSKIWRLILAYGKCYLCRTVRRGHRMVKFTRFPGMTDWTSRTFRLSRRYLKMTGQKFQDEVGQKFPQEKEADHMSPDYDYDHKSETTIDFFDLPVTPEFEEIIPKVEPLSPPTKSPRKFKAVTPEVIVLSSSDDEVQRGDNKNTAVSSSTRRHPRKQKKMAPPISSPDEVDYNPNVSLTSTSSSQSEISLTSHKTRTAQSTLSPPTFTPPHDPNPILDNSSSNKKLRLSTPETHEGETTINGAKRSLSPPTPVRTSQNYNTDHDDRWSITSTSTLSSGKSRQRRNQMQQHLCQICKRTDFRDRHHYRNHVLVHEGRLPYLCPQCDMGYDDEIKLLQHVSLRHTGEPAFKCDKCGVEYRVKRGLDKHKCVSS